MATFVSGDPIDALLRKEKISLVNLVTQASKIAAKDFDLIWGHHWPVWGYCINELEIRYRYLICSSLSPFAPLEAIPPISAVVDKILFNSVENLDSTRGSPFDKLEENSMVFPSSF